MAKCKSPGRKAAKKPAPKLPYGIDDDLAKLASVIAEYQLDNNAAGWFRLPWRNGWNAAHLAYALWEQGCPKSHDYHVANNADIRLAAEAAKRLLATRVAETFEYVLLEDLIEALGPGECAQALRAVLRCIQITIANSSGGGHAFNDVLRSVVEGLPEEDVVDFITEWRCHDAIGTGPQLTGDANDRQRHAFVIAWRKGLYFAAYSLPPAIDYSKHTLHAVKE